MCTAILSAMRVHPRYVCEHHLRLRSDNILVHQALALCLGVAFGLYPVVPLSRVLLTPRCPSSDPPCSSPSTSCTRLHGRTLLAIQILLLVNSQCHFIVPSLLLGISIGPSNSCRWCCDQQRPFVPVILQPLLL